MTFILPTWSGRSKGNPSNLAATNPDLSNPGIYIIGVKAHISSNGVILENPEKGSEEKFLPFYSGMVNPGGELIDRIKKHYDTYGIFNSKKKDALFNFSPGTSVCRIYEAIEIFNRIWIEPGYFVKTRTIAERCRLYTAINSIEIQNEYMLLFFQCTTSHDFKLGIPCIAFILNNFSSHENAYETYNLAGDPVSSNLKVSYIKTKNFILDNFYFVYLPMPDVTRDDIFQKEVEVKYFLQSNYGVYTQNQLETPSSKRRWKDFFMRPQVVYTNPFDFTMPAGNCLDDIIFKRNDICSRNPILDEVLEKYKKHSTK